MSSRARFVRALVILLVCILGVAPLSGAQSLVSAESTVGVEPETNLRLHGSIRIDGPADLTPDNGVRGGSGSEDDPFVIAGWHIVQTRAYGIHLGGTEAHVLIRDVFIEGETGAAWSSAGCPVDDGTCRQYSIHVTDAANVTIERVRVAAHGSGITFTRASNVTVKDTVIAPIPVVRGTEGWVRDNGFVGLNTIDVNGLRAENLTVRNTTYPVGIIHSADVTLTRSTFDGGLNGASLYLHGPASNLRVDNSQFTNTKLWVTQNDIQGLAIVDNEFRDGSTGFQMTNTDGRLQGLVICGNDFTGFPSVFHSAVFITKADDVLLRANAFRHVVRGISVGESSNVLIEDNLMEHISGSGLRISSTAIIRNNHLAGDPAADIWANQVVDARDNWWGHASGPSGYGPGTGARVESLRGNSLLHPWLESPPALTLTCGGSADGAGVEDLDRPSANATVTARVEVSAAGEVLVDEQRETTVRSREYVLP